MKPLLHPDQVSFQSYNTHFMYISNQHNTVHWTGEHWTWIIPQH